VPDSAAAASVAQFAEAAQRLLGADAVLGLHVGLGDEGADPDRGERRLHHDDQAADAEHGVCGRPRGGGQRATEQRERDQHVDHVRAVEDPPALPPDRPRAFHERVGVPVADPAEQAEDPDLLCRLGAEQ
jgi:hypothetical protein